MLSRNSIAVRPARLPSDRRLVPFRDAVIPVVVVAGVIALVFPDRTLPYVPLVAGVTIAAFLLIRNSAVWALAPALIVEFTASTYVNPQIHVSARLAVLLVAVLASLPLIVAALQRDDPFFKRVLIPAMVLLAVETLRNLTSTDPGFTVKYARYTTTLIISLVLTASVIRTRADVKRIAAFTLALGIINAVAALWQHYSSGTALFVAATEQTMGSWEGRSLGLSTSPVILAATILFVAAPAVGLLLTGPSRVERIQRWLAFAVVLLGVGIYFAYTRSALIGLGAGVAAVGIQLKGQRRQVVLGLVVGAVALYEVLQGTGLVGARYYSSTDDSAASHVVLWTADLQIALDNAFIGIGNANFKEVSEQYASQISQGLSSADMIGLKGLGTEEPHNDFLYVWLSWGIVAIIAYLLVFVGALRNFWTAAKNAGGWVSRFAIACSGGLVAYAANSAFHNYLDSSTMLWLYAGASVALARLPAAVQASPLSARQRRRQRARLRRLYRATSASS